MGLFFRSSAPLRAQKPRRRTRRGSAMRWRWVLLLPVLSFVVYVAYLHFEVELLWKLQSLKSPGSLFSSSSQPHPSERVYRPWRVSVEGDHKTPPAKNWKFEIIETIKQHLKEGRRDELAHVARLVLKSSMYDQVQLTRLAPRHVLVKVRVPSSIALIKADVLRFLSPHGHVFGRAKAEDYPELPQITGVFPNPPSKFPALPNNKLILSSKTQDILREILAALDLITEAGLSLETLHYDLYRGVHIRLKDHVLVALGHPPYEKKITRLSSILIEAVERGEELRKVELDFEGKAFVQSQDVTKAAPGRL